MLYICIVQKVQMRNKCAIQQGDCITEVETCITKIHDMLYTCIVENIRLYNQYAMQSGDCITKFENCIA